MGLESDQRSVRDSQNNEVVIALGDTSGFPHSFFILSLSQLVLPSTPNL